MARENSTHLRYAAGAWDAPYRARTAVTRRRPQGDPDAPVLPQQGRDDGPDDYSGGPGVKDYTDQPDEQRLAPDDPRKPAAPTDLGKRTWLGVAKRAFTEFKDDNITDWAAALTYYAVLSIFPGDHRLRARCSACSARARTPSAS